ncbi:putative DUF775 domain protein [Toxoplasma gondii TgCatPRC2]|uniref:DUF775 domain protein n=11 Tax=Toxoplasma gondii TaxID=5811 RepID=A0A125YSM8_TOXGV|nr:hypothetical protein TGME49_236030 [Toxoplasma gondii ME49]ESS30968.1 putative DUF775 domain protein [Toxoplasma gondii VEG]KFG31618.1 putative DUF775 domain protein [Toxoplasma gondii GAB2-2007-GAL-DOM2]KFG32614.1 putative DUF775 domain protein [Toxoplasma gondii FOU]KFH03969.1 putative DUF775 domain protein [Toxoplasma gondii MAS]KFH07436.1 putative DUF775 domain protein [Toxoplasma gondii VAND]KYF43108.1 putative DUF775 domain protein [Toxoplasma gondii ARI]KYK64230.1 putative DUF775 d|eukprot:XP_018635807.1 hypothetical protein TGME49_236030 [Toxoplasma gondii ME49]
MSLFGVVVPGRPCLAPTQVTGQAPALGTFQSGQWVCDLVNPGEISDLVCFLTSPLPSNNEGAGIYYSVAPFTDWEFMGVITNNRPSVLLSPGWSLLPQVNQQPIVKLGVSLESAEVLQEKLLTKPPPDVKKEYARRVALNLYRYIESFQGGAAMPLLDQWFQRCASHNPAFKHSRSARRSPDTACTWR